MRSRLRVVSSFIITALVLLVCLIAVQLRVTSAQEDLQSTLIAIEKSLWEGWKSGDAAPFEKYLNDGYVQIEASGVTAGKAQNIQALSSHRCDVRSYDFSDWKIHRLSGDAVMLTYKATQDATCEGRKSPSPVYAVSLYVKQSGKWTVGSYFEVAAEK